MTTRLDDIQLKAKDLGRERGVAAAGPLSTEELRKTDAFWRACNYLAAGMIYLRDNPLLR